MHAKRQVLFVQGGGKGTHDDWDSRLVESLRRELGRDYDVRYPRMPGEETPTYRTWKVALVRELESLPRDAILVGHSLGATILLGVLAERVAVAELAAIFLLAPPFVGKGGWPAEDLQIAAGLGAQLPDGVPVHIFHGLEDDVVPPAHLDLYAHAVPQAHVHRLPGRDHQLNNNLHEVAAAIAAIA